MKEQRRPRNIAPGNLGGPDAGQAAEHHFLKRQSGVENYLHLSGDEEPGLQPLPWKAPQSSTPGAPPPSPTPCHWCPLGQRGPPSGAGEGQGQGTA